MIALDNEAQQNFILAMIMSVVKNWAAIDRYSDWAGSSLGACQLGNRYLWENVDYFPDAFEG